MSYLRRISSGAVSHSVDSESVLYQTLAGLRDANSKAIFEDVGEQQISGATSRFLAIVEPGAATASDEVAVLTGELPGRAGTITVAEFFVNSPGIVGANTNSRSIIAQQPGVTGTASPVRAVTALATLALTVGVNATPGTPAPMTINNAAFVGDNPVEVVSNHVGTGLADPGGVVVLTYTPA